MDANEFITDLFSSYPEPLRPDDDFTRIIQKEIKKRPVMSAVFIEALRIIQNSFRMFPTIPDINYAFVEAFKTVYKGQGPKTCWEFFEVEGISYRRDVSISPEGDIVRKPLPYGATNYFLSVPAELESDKNWITADQAYEQGCISDDVYRAMKSAKENSHAYKGRFKKIGELIHNESHSGIVPEDFIDDSMASNPESEAFEDI